MDEWRGYFMEILEKTQEKIILEIGNSEGEEEGKVEIETVGDITREETIEEAKKSKSARRRRD